MSWRPSASIERLAARSKLLQDIRVFFTRRGLLEVDTPAIARATASDPCLASMHLDYDDKRYYLQTSPEQHMKRLMAAGSGDIFQLCKAFRKDELGSRHNPEFTILEWYRTEFALESIATECCHLIQFVASVPASIGSISYSELFVRFCNCDPLLADEQDLLASLPHPLRESVKSLNYYQLVDYVFAMCIEPDLGHNELMLVTDFPVWTAALADTRKRADGCRVSQRFELYWQGIELANGYQELLDAGVLRDRYKQDSSLRKEAGLEYVPYMLELDEAMVSGLPSCSGVALGVDRLLMLACGAESLAEVMAFPFDIA